MSETARSPVSISGSPPPGNPADTDAGVSSALLRAALNASGDAITIKDADLVFRFANQAFAAMVGQPLDAIIGHTGLDWLPSERVDEVHDIDRAVLKQNRSMTGERYLWFRGAGLWVSYRKDPVVLDGGGRGIITVIRDISDQVRTHNELTRKTDLLDRFFDQSVFNVAWLDKDLRFLRVNRGCAENRRHPPDAFIGEPYFDLYPDAENEALFRRVLASGEPYRESARAFEFPDQPDRGRTYWDLDLRPVHDADGTPAGLIVTLVDVTDREKAIQALRDGEREKALILDSIGDLVMYYGMPDRRVLWTNAVAAEMFGIRPGDADAHPCLALWSESGGPCADCPILRCFETQVAQETEKISRDGREWAMRAFPAFHEDGHLNGVVVIARDITALCEARRALENSEDRLRLAMEAARDGIWDLDVRTGRITGNDRWLSMLGYAPKDLCLSREALKDLLHPDDYPVMLAATGEGLKSDNPFQGEYRLRRADGGWLWVLVRGRVVARDEDGRALRMVGTNTDIGAHKKIERDLMTARIAAEAASQAKSQFLAAMSHDLRTPLTAILGFSEVMKTEVLGQLGHPRYVEYANDIHRSGQYLIDLVDDLLDLAKIEAGARALSLEPIDVAQLVTESLRLVRHTAATHGVALEADLPETVPAMVADRRAILQVLFNLLSNAIKYTPKGGRVVLSAAADDDGTTFSITDTGIGMGENELTTLFEPFRRAVEVQHRQIQGTGLGLAIVKALMDLHGGTITVTSVPSAGSMFTITLPTESDQPED